MSEYCNNCFVLAEENEKLKEELKYYKINVDFLINNLQKIWGKQIAEDQNDCRCCICPKR